MGATLADGAGSSWEYVETGLLENLGNRLSWEAQSAELADRFAAVLGPIGRKQWQIHRP